ncbi:MAG: TonB-dependent receptor [Bacteroidia bacterium]|nr:TonB-dependent receptor [Bacteroidia bacterium]
MKRQFILLILSVFGVMCVYAQPLTQTVRGNVIDKISQNPVPGAIVTLENSNPVNGTTTDINGKFMLKNVPVGRQSIKVTYVGYKDFMLPNIIVNSGKEVVLIIQLEEAIVLKRTIVVKANQQKNKPVNEIAAVSTRTFSVEETQKFAAAVNDPARMATSFAGVVQGDDGSNYISIRGNSPNSMIWRMDGVDIPNPNHFAGVGTSGGGISILSAQLMSNSDFLTGAFTAEYGNALSGVFDIRLRKGNNQKKENTFQAGLLGIDLATEGPIKKGYEGSYLINYRYSTLSLLSMVGVKVGAGVTNFQDLSFNISLPAGKSGVFGVFGFGGLSSQKMTAEKDSMKWKEDPFYRYNSKFNANTGAAGVSYMQMLSKKTYIKSILAMSGSDYRDYGEELNLNYVAIQKTDERFVNSKITWSSLLNYKMNTRNSLRSGIILNSLYYNLSQNHRNDSLGFMETEIDTRGQTQTVQLYSNWNHKAGDRLTVNTGFHTLHLLLNGAFAIEPRASVSYAASEKRTIAIGYGLHSQIQPLGAYFTRNPATNAAMNKNLGMSKAHHLVLSHDINVSTHTHIKTEVYYQHLFNIPVSAAAGSTLSMINVVDGYVTDKLVNKGKGRNYGLELTIERFLHKNFYYLLSASLYDSRYRTLDGHWFNTRFNTGRSASFTVGKEWQLSEKRKNKIIGMNIKCQYAGGLRYSPIDLNASVAKGETQFVESKAYTIQNPDYFRLDVRVSMKRNFKHSTGTLALDIQNSTNRKNIGGQYYDVNTGKVKYWYQTPLIPVLSYRLEF